MISNKKKELKVEVTIQYDPAENNNKPANIFLYQLLTRLDREHPILEIGYRGVKKTFRNGEDFSKIAFRKIDSVDDKELPNNKK